MVNGRVDGTLVGRRIRERREASGLSIGQLAAYAPVSKAYISRLENGKLPRPSATKLQDIARVLNCTVQDLIAPESGDPTTDVEVPVGKAPVVRRLLRYSVDQLNRLAEAAAIMFSTPMDDEAAKENAEDEGDQDDKHQQPPDHATIARPIVEAEHRHPHRIRLLEQAFVT